eukprot:GHVN01038519.1.p1 GENE.GHVN01038519.1~~GHVN01038519.1.p1  ORF type:complete len:254 (+),score=19.34 GHVN01038519.1:100-861(+)
MLRPTKFKRLAKCGLSPIAACAAAEFPWNGLPIKGLERPQHVPNFLWSKIGSNLHLKTHHPVSILREKVENNFNQERPHQTLRSHGIGSSPNRYEFNTFTDFLPVVSSRQAFDDLLIPTDHPSRSTSDTYYLARSDYSHLMDESQLADSFVLRPQATAHQTSLLKRGESAALWAAEVYRKDQADSLHYPIFHQMDGINTWPISQIESGTQQSGLTVVTDAENEYSIPVLNFVVADLKFSLERLSRSLFGINMG